MHQRKLELDRKCERANYSEKQKSVTKEQDLTKAKKMHIKRLQLMLSDIKEKMNTGIIDELAKNTYEKKLEYHNG